jgi:hypothetical protein
MWTSVPRINHEWNPDVLFIFNLHKESLFIKHTQIHVTQNVGHVSKYKKTLTWNGGPLSMVANPHP